MTEFDRRGHIIVPVSDLTVANSLADGWDPDIGGSLTFSVPLSASGEAPATHYACSSLFTSENFEYVESRLSSDLPDATVFRGNNDFDFENGVTRYTFFEAIAEMSLQRIIASF